MYKLVLAVVLASVLLLCGCGGVGGASTSTGPPQSPGPAPAPEYLYVTHGTDTGVTAFLVDPATGALSEVTGSPFAMAGTSRRVQALCISGNSCDSIPRPIAADPLGKFLYVLEPDTSGVRAFQINASTGAIAPITALAYDTGDDPQDVRIDPSGRFLYVDGGSPPSITAFSIDPNTGALRSVANSPFATPELPFLMTTTSCCLYAASTDQPGGVLGYRIDPGTGALSEIAGQPFASGQSTVAVAATATGSYVLAVDDTRNLLSAFRADATTGALSQAVSSVPIGSNPVMMSASPQGFFYVSTGDGVSGFALNEATGVLTAAPGVLLVAGAGAIASDPPGKFVFALDTTNNTVVSLAINPDGSLRQAAVSQTGATAYVNLVAVGGK